MGRPIVRIGLFLIAAALAWPVAQGLSVLIPWLRTNFDVLGDKPLLDYALGFSTLIIAGMAAYFAWMSFRLNSDIALSARFQKAVELMANSAEPTRFGGVTILAEVARLSFKQYGQATTMTLLAYIGESTAAILDKIANQPPASPLPSTPMSAAAAAVSLWDVDTRHFRVLGHERREQMIASFYLAQISFNNRAVKKWDSTFHIGGLTSFYDFEFENCVFEFRNLSSDPERVVFDNCKFKNVTFQRVGKITCGIRFKNGCILDETTRIDGTAVTMNGDY